MEGKLLSWFEKRHRSRTLNLAYKQMVKAIDTVVELERAMLAASNGRREEAEKCLERLLLAEEEVDDLRRVVFEELSKGSLRLTDREDLMHLIKRLDVMADYVKDSARSVKVLIDSYVPKEIWDGCVNMAGRLVECAKILHKSIEKLGSDLDMARELAHKVDLIEHEVDEAYLKMRTLFIKYGKEVDAATLIILKDLVEFMEHVADICTDTGDYIRILAATGESS